MAPYSSLPAHWLVSKCSTCNCSGFLFLGTLPSGPASGTPTSVCPLLLQTHSSASQSYTLLSHQTLLLGWSFDRSPLSPPMPELLQPWPLQGHLFSSHLSYLTPRSGQTKGNSDSLSEPICLFFQQWRCSVSINSCFFSLLGTASLIIRWAGKCVLVNGKWRKSWLLNKFVPLSNAFSSLAPSARHEGALEDGEPLTWKDPRALNYSVEEASLPTHTQGPAPCMGLWSEWKTNLNCVKTLRFGGCLLHQLIIGLLWWLRC